VGDVKPCGYIVSYDRSAGVGLIRPAAETGPDVAGKASKSPQEQAVGGELLLFHEEDRLDPTNWMPTEGTPVSYEETGRKEDVYRVVAKVVQVRADVPEQDKAPEGTVVLEPNDPASQAAY
jgi:hypothetical protein